MKMVGHTANIVLFRGGLKCLKNCMPSRLKNGRSPMFYSNVRLMSSQLPPSRSCCLPLLLRVPQFGCGHRFGEAPFLPSSILLRGFVSGPKEPSENPSMAQTGSKDEKVEAETTTHKLFRNSFDDMTIGFEAKPHPDDDTSKLASGDKPNDGQGAYNENTLVPDFRAIKDFLLTYNDLHKLPSMTRRSPYYGKPYITVYRRKDLERRAIEKWGSLRNLEVQRKYIKAKIAKEKEDFMAADLSGKNDRFAVPYEEFNFYKTKEDPTDKRSPFGVVSFAIGFNALNCFLKMGAWLYTGSHSMFAEFIHSVADTANQIILFIGIRKSMKEPDLAHPYGFAKITNITSLMSGLGIFFLGAGLNIYHGFLGLLNPAESSSLYWALAVLGTSFVTEGATLMLALNRLRESSKMANMTLYDYISRAIDPTTNVVLLEDSAAVLGTLIAGTCISIAHFTSYSIADPIGSLLIGSLLGGVASIIISTNAGVLVGRSIPADKRQVLVSELEAHKMIRSTIDVKATEVGGKSVKFKAEVDFDGREITKHYLNEIKAIDEELLREMQGLKTPEEAREFLLRHGEGIVDHVGVVIDDIEKDFKGRHPEIKYCDLEQL